MSSSLVRKYILDIFNPVCNGTNKDNTPDGICSLIYSFIPGDQLRHMIFDRAINISLNCVKMYLISQPETEVTDVYFKMALTWGKPDVADFLLTTYLPDLSYDRQFIERASLSKDVKTLSYVGSLSQRYFTPTSQDIEKYNAWRRTASECYLREKLLMLKELKQYWQITPIILPGETDPATTISPYEFSGLVPWCIGYGITFKMFEYLRVAGCHYHLKYELWNKDHYSHDPRATLKIAKYLYRRVPCVFNCGNISQLLRIIFDATACDDVEFVAWIMDLRGITQDTITERNVVEFIERIHTRDAIKILTLIEERWNCCNRDMDCKCIIAQYNSIKIFDHYAKTRGFTQQELDVMLHDSCVNSLFGDDIYFRLIHDYNMVPTAKELDMILRGARYSVSRSMFHDFHLRPTTPEKYLDTLHGHNTVAIDVAMTEHPEIFTDQILLQVIQSDNFSDAGVNRVINHIRHHDPAGANMLAREVASRWF